VTKGGGSAESEELKPIISKSGEAATRIRVGREGGIFDLTSRIITFWG
jgi:hypothetical protein